MGINKTESKSTKKSTCYHSSTASPEEGIDIWVLDIWSYLTRCCWFSGINLSRERGLGLIWFGTKG